MSFYLNYDYRVTQLYLSYIIECVEIMSLFIVVVVNVHVLQYLAHIPSTEKESISIITESNSSFLIFGNVYIVFY